LPHIIVVGAGMSGLVAARILHDTGFSVEVFEARNRLGGRIWTDHLLGIPCDLGASWIHGPEDNPLTAWSAVAGIDLLAWPGGRTYFYERGHVSSLPRLLWRGRRGVARAMIALTKSYMGLRLNNLLGRAKDLSLEQSIAAATTFPRLKDVDSRILLWLLGLAEAVFGAPASELSLLEWDPREYREKHLVPAHGFQDLISNVCRGLSIRLAAEVSKIVWDREGVRVVTAAGAAYSAAAVVIAVPLGVLKSGSLCFEPSLAANKRAAIERIGFGGRAVLNKLVLRFPRRFWPTVSERLAVLPVDRQNRGIFTLWADLQSLVGEPVIMGFMSGTAAADLDRNGSDGQICDKAMAQLQRMFSVRLPAPEGYVLTRWLSDPWSRGSYSYRAMGGKESDRQVLAEPVADRLFFAGEATHEEHYGTVHGALLAGEREALRIHRRYCCASVDRSQLPWYKTVRA